MGSEREVPAERLAKKKESPFHSFRTEEPILSVAPVRFLSKWAGKGLLRSGAGTHRRKEGQSSVLKELPSSFDPT